MSFSEQIAAQAAANKVTMQANRQARADHKTIAKFEGVTLTGADVSYGRQGGPTQGAVARVEMGADIQSRITATRLIGLGVFALAAKKKTGHVFLTIEGQGFQVAIEVDRKHEAEARQFAAQVNTAARR